MLSVTLLEFKRIEYHSKWSQFLSNCFSFDFSINLDKVFYYYRLLKTLVFQNTLYYILSRLNISYN